MNISVNGYCFFCGCFFLIIDDFVVKSSRETLFFICLFSSRNPGSDGLNFLDISGCIRLGMATTKPFSGISSEGYNSKSSGGGQSSDMELSEIFSSSYRKEFFSCWICPDVVNVFSGMKPFIVVGISSISSSSFPADRFPKIPSISRLTLTLTGRMFPRLLLEIRGRLCTFDILLRVLRAHASLLDMIKH